MVLDVICSRANFSFNTIQHLISNTISNVDFNVFKRSNVYSNVFIKNNKSWSDSFSSQFYDTSIMSSSEEETSPVKGRAFKAHIKDKEKQEKAKMVQEVADDKMVEGKDTTNDKIRIRTHSQWFSCGTYLWNPFSLQPLTIEICFGSIFWKYVLEICFGNMLEICFGSLPFDLFSFFPSTRFSWPESTSSVKIIKTAPLYAVILKTQEWMDDREKKCWIWMLDRPFQTI